ncbi:extensin-like domain-containing protein [Aliihoeflea sp. PC F10.4]
MRSLSPIALSCILFLTLPAFGQDEPPISLPDEGPIPQDSPAQPADQPDIAEDDDEQPDDPKSVQTMPAEEKACRSRLRELGVTFTEYPPQSEPDGCEMAHPVTVSSLGDDVALEPEAVMNCAAAEANAQFLKDHAQQEATRHMSSRIDTVNQVSAYVCRPRAGTRKLSEHAFGNALDWGAILFENGERLEVRQHRRGSPEALFLAALRRHGCGIFKTVLGPGSDADHADHLHFDLAERRNGSTYCR